ncbi:hypothetical protein C4J81_04845 [Deltaproteobacteria bacterium Smac51]|nr:hypothetical protein C4J81_04845 [Deltaproteobacteria bacterium Smac51]
MTSWLKKLWPDSLCGQLLLTLLLSAIVLQGINLYAVCYIQHSYNREVHTVRYDYNSSIYMALSNMEPEQRVIFLDGLSKSQAALSQPFQFVITSHAPAWQTDSSDIAGEATEKMGKALSAAGADGVQIRARMLEKSAPDAAHPFYSGSRFPLVQMILQMDDQSWLKITQPIYISNTSAVWWQRLFILMESILFSVVTFVLIIQATKPLSRMVQAAEAFGRNPESAQPLPEAGGREIREASQSFNRMRERICNNLSERNRMLEAMGHDLRTPLARIHLRADKIQPDSLREQFVANIQEIQSIIEQGLELARSLHTSEKPVPLDVAAFTQSIVDDLEAQGQSVFMEEAADDESAPLLVLARPTCLRRCLENLLTNAVKYGTKARISITRLGDDKVAIDVADEGPGIPEELLEKVFEPYYRLERSRNRESGGTGLGLSIARNMVLLNNGFLSLSNRPEGGLLARITLLRF